MKFHKCRIIAYLCLAALLLAGCSKEVNFGPGAMGSEVWEQWPTLTYGTMETEKLAVLPWNSGRCEATSRCALAETENGFYYLSNLLLYYADKINLGNWIPLCNQPDCTHDATASCNAYIEGNSFVIKDGHIYYEADSKSYPELYLGKGSGTMLLSMASDGTDKQFAYAIEDAMDTLGGGSESALLSAEHWLYGKVKLKTDGSYTVQIFRVTDNGEKLLLSQPLGEEYNHVVLPAGFLHGINGDWAYTISALGTIGSKVYRIEEDQFEEIDLTSLPTQGGYLSGNTLRCFRENDGYYDIDLETREEVRLANARLENSHSAILLPNCIVESTLLYAFSTKDRAEGITHSMELFDGEIWRTVKLPEELVNARKTVFVYIEAVTSDSILFGCRDAANYGAPTSLYRVPLDSEELVMEYCGEVKLPTEDEK